MNKPPAFQFYADDFIGGTVDLTTEQVGAYIRLLCYQWNKGFIPENAESINRIAGCNVCQDVIAKFPNQKNARLEVERQKQADYREKQSQKGKASVEARFNRGSTVVQPSAVEARFNSPSPSPSPSREREKDFAETPPMSRKDFNQLAEARGISKDCAEWFWNNHDARNWLDFSGQPIRKVEPLLLNAWTSWRQKAAKVQSKNRVAEMTGSTPERPGGRM